jgi:hypothetical protein
MLQLTQYGGVSQFSCPRLSDWLDDVHRPHWDSAEFWNTLWKLRNIGCWLRDPIR